LAGKDVGWGWNAEAAKRNAATYVWTGDEMLFQIGTSIDTENFDDLVFMHFSMSTFVNLTLQCDALASEFCLIYFS